MVKGVRVYHRNCSLVIWLWPCGVMFQWLLWVSSKRGWFIVDAVRCSWWWVGTVREGRQSAELVRRTGCGFRFQNRGFVYRLHRVHEMQPIATDSQSVSLSVTRLHSASLCKNGRTDQDHIWVEHSWGPKKHCVRWGSTARGGRFNAAFVFSWYFELKCICKHTFVNYFLPTTP